MWELDKLCTFTDVRKRVTVDEVEAASRGAAYIIGMSMQGARWNGTNSTIEKSKPKEMFCTMPIISVKGVLREGRLQGHVLLPHLSDPPTRADLHFLRAAQDQVASGPLGAGGRSNGDGSGLRRLLVGCFICIFVYMGWVGAWRSGVSLGPCDARRG